MAVEQASLRDLWRIIDQHTPLQGEDTTSLDLDDALHWIYAYGELIERLSDSVPDDAEEMPVGRSEDSLSDAHVDHRLLQEQAQRYRVRRAFWLKRAARFADSREGGALVEGGHERGQIWTVSHGG